MKTPAALAVCVLALASLLPLASRAQSSRVPEYVPKLNLRVTGVTTVQGLWAGPLMNPLRCDAAGNIYLRLFGGARMVLQSPVTRISADGEQTRTFSLQSVPGFASADVVIQTFAVAPDGAVLLGAWGQDPKEKKLGGYIFRLRSDGTFDFTINLGPFSPDQVAVFGNGNLLVSGTKTLRLYGKNEPPVPVAANEVIDDAGELIKTITLPDDVEPLKPTDPSFKKDFGVEPGEITVGNAVTGSDGYVYLMRHTGNPKVYVISPDGSLVRRFELKPPAPGAMASATVGYSPEEGGELLLPFQLQGPRPGGRGVRATGAVILAYSAETGKRLMDYTVPPEIGEAMACYSPNGFTFVGTTERHQVVLRQVKPR